MLGIITTIEIRCAIIEKSYMLNSGNYISLKEAAKLTGYSSDYVGSLIRSGKIRMVVEFTFESQSAFIEVIDWRGNVYK